MNICIWNINCATNRGITIPEFVAKEIIRQKCDLLVLTEFCRTVNYKRFIQTITNEGYDYVFTIDCSGNNDVLLAYKKSKYERLSAVDNISTNDTTPNFAYVELKEKATNGMKFVLAGVRITINNYTNRASQFSSVLDSLKDYEHVIIGGDFNCLRRGTPVREWCLSVLNAMSIESGFNLVTPAGQSIYSEKAVGKEFEFAEDHLVVKGAEIVNEKYDRSFTDQNSNIYIHGRNFSVYDSSLRRNIWQIPVGTGIPDHAILTGEIILSEK